MSRLMQHMRMEYHKPGDKVITQNEPVIGENGQFYDYTSVHFVIEGVYRRLSMQFDKEHSLTRMTNDESKLTSLIYDDIKGCYKLS